MSEGIEKGKNPRRGILIVLSGFSGSGKGTVVKELLRCHGEQFALSVSATTRQPRAGEAEGREYFFKTREEFEKMIEKNELIEYAWYVENYYGTPRAYVEEQLAGGKDVILEIEVQGAKKVKARFPDTLLLFVTPPDAATLRSRLAGRGTESPESVEARLAQAFEESRNIGDYDYLVVNRDGGLAACVEEVYSAIQTAHREVGRNQDFIRSMREELGHFSKGESL